LRSLPLSGGPAQNRRRRTCPPASSVVRRRRIGTYVSMITRCARSWLGPSAQSVLAIRTASTRRYRLTPDGLTRRLRQRCHRSLPHQERHPRVNLRAGLIRPAPSINRFLIKFYETGMGWICHAYRPGVHKPPQSNGPEAGRLCRVERLLSLNAAGERHLGVATRSTRRKLESPFAGERHEKGYSDSVAGFRRHRTGGRKFSERPIQR
jgi:hypothetical protein